MKRIAKFGFMGALTILVQMPTVYCTTTPSEPATDEKAADIKGEEANNADQPDVVVDSILTMLGPILGKISYGSCLGGCAGYALKKMTKAAAMAIGGVFWWKTKKKGNYHFGDEGSPKTRGRRESNSDISTPLAGDQEGDHGIDGQNGRSTQTNGGMGRVFSGIGSPKMGKMKMVPSASIDPYEDGIDVGIVGVEMESIPTTSPVVEVKVSFDELKARSARNGHAGPPPVPSSGRGPPPVPQKALHDMGVTHQ